MKFILTKKKENVEVINAALLANPHEVIQAAEDAFYKEISNACDAIIEQDKHIILLSGPSGSGKTTTSKMMVEELEKRGKKGMRVSLDNFYRNRDDMPSWRNGRTNFESVEGLDLAYLGNRIHEVLTTGYAKFPIFDFPNGRRGEKTFDVHFDDETFLIFEGIHALRPEMDEHIDTSKSLKIYISVHTELVDNDNKVVLTPRDLRLMRRLLRDSWARATTAGETFWFWGDVIKGEEQYIWPFRNFADIHINSTHSYEAMLLKDAVLAVLDVGPEHEFPQMESALREGLSKVVSIDKSLMPKTSLMREFIQL